MSIIIGVRMQRSRTRERIKHMLVDDDGWMQQA